MIINEDIRATGVDKDHVRGLADCDVEWPPILVQKGTMRVIDGMHRLRAAEMRGNCEIQVQFLDVDDEHAYLQGVAANVTHGLPLSLSDRKAAALRIMRMRPEWSDRAIGRACGISGKTVGSLRDREKGDAEPAARRIGRDGRSRPVDNAAGRRIAQELLAARPDSSLRKIAQEACVSPGTVRRVRDAMVERESAGAGPADADIHPRTTMVRRVPSPAGRRSAPLLSEVNANAILENLRQDPSLRYRAEGRRLLRLLHQRPALALGPGTIEAIPEHWLPAISVLARICAQEWVSLAEAVEAPRPTAPDVAVGERASG
ncbi:ParB N-terminal domain-containing protein [Streptomyces sp. NPDC050164]|uniref:ParB N-terminal domain-containing protein n=1 Tax=Streptomyces sp. NPDC050164 TaxID=3365605 RepID=UPI0037AE25C5